MSAVVVTKLRKLAAMYQARHDGERKLPRPRLDCLDRDNDMAVTLRHAAELIERAPDQARTQEEG